MPYLNFAGELEEIFKETFLANATLYQQSKKVKLPYEDLKSTTALYKGSLVQEDREVSLVSDYRLLQEIADFKTVTEQDIAKTPLPDVLRDYAIELATQAAIGIDTLIRIENGKVRDGGDPRNTTMMVVTDIFHFADGRPNFQLFVVENTAPSVVDPAGVIKGWIAYKLYFACAHVRMEYKN